MFSHRLVATRRKACVYIVIVVCLFVLHFKVSQDAIPSLKPKTFLGCLNCHGISDDDGNGDDVSNFNAHSSLQSDNNNKSLLSLGRMTKESKDRSTSLNTLNLKTREKHVQYKDLHQHTTTTTDTLTDREMSVSATHGVIEDIRQEREKKYRYHTSKNGTFKRKHSFVPPRNEKPIRRYPQCVIIGFAKCGTRALLDFLSLHPYVVTHGAEMHFYDKDENFQKGSDWYRSQMPRSFSNQITVEKTPAYILFPRAQEEMYKLTPSVKLIILVRDPVVRLVSQFLLRYRNVLPFKEIPVEVIYRDSSTGDFKPDYKPVVTGIYYKHFAMWLERFPREQFLILNGEYLSADPLPVLRQVEAFLDIPPMFEESNFYYNESSGFFCPRGFEKDATPQCLGKLKGVKHPKLPDGDEEMLYQFYRPLNEQFFQLAKQRFVWEEREWKRYQ